MIRFELYQRGRPLVVIDSLPGANAGAWARLQEAFSRGIVGGSAKRMDVRVDVFFAELPVVQEIRRQFGQAVELGPTLSEQLKGFREERRQLHDAETSTADPAMVEAELQATGFKRDLKAFQLDNLSTIMSLPHGADFSVPGAGKTTVALANFTLNRARDKVDQMLVVAPIAAFQAWKEDSAACMDPAPVVSVHSGPGSLIRDDTDILLTNYNRVSSDYDAIRAFVARRRTQVVLDEAHRIKRGDQGVHGRAVLDLAYAARRRDVLTGTPAPQGAFDVVALMRFLYPGQDRQILPSSTYTERDGREDHVLRATSRALTRYFVRTPKSELDLPPTEFEVVVEPMRPLQAAIYDALVGRYRGALALDTSSRRRFDRLGRIVMYLLEAATNPMLLVAGSDHDDETGFAHPPLEIQQGDPISELLQRYREYETPWKYDRVRAIVEAAESGAKIIVWSTFVRNIRALASYLAPHEPAVVHGGVPPADGARPGQITREHELNRFRYDPACRVLLANPAACGEGVSLHHWCHHAIYLDRTFNAGHYLQSQDRIHRLGLAKDVRTQFTVLLSEGTIDQAVDGRLREKVTALATLMDDPGLVRVALPEPDVGEGEQPAYDDDMQAVAALLRATKADVL